MGSSLDRLSFRLAKVFKLSGKGRGKLFLLAYVVLLFFGGIWQNPFFALIVAAIYDIGLVGLVMLYDARLRPDFNSQVLYGFLGGLLLFICWCWLEILVEIMPFIP